MYRDKLQIRAFTTLTKIPQFSCHEIMRETRRIDVVWFNKTGLAFPQKVFEAVDSIGTLNGAFNRSLQCGIPPAVAIRKAFFWSLAMIAPVAAWGATDSGFCAMDGSFSVNFNIEDNIERFSSVRNWANLAFLGAVASAAAFALWNCTCKGLGVVKATALLYLVPVAGVVFATGFLGESVAPMGIAGGALIIAGVAVTGRGMKKKVGE